MRGLTDKQPERKPLSVRAALPLQTAQSRAAAHFLAPPVFVGIFPRGFPAESAGDTQDVFLVGIGGEARGPEGFLSSSGEKSLGKV